MDATLLLTRRPAAPGAGWLGRSLAALALRFRDARVRLFTADIDACALGPGARVPPAASFDTAVLIERAKSKWSIPIRPETSDDDDESLAWLAGARGYRVAVRRLLDASRSPRAGERSPGLVFAATTVRAPALDPEAFDAHWSERHAPLALAHHTGMCSYEQLRVRSALTARAPAIDGLALLHFADLDSYRSRFFDSDAGRAAIAADTLRFLDLPRCEAALLGEHWARP